MSGGSGGGVCRCCLKLQLTLGLMALVLWLTYRPIKPRYYITAFSVTSNATNIASFNLEIENKNKQMGINHDALAVTLSFGPNRTAVGHGPTIIPSFYQGHQKTAEKPSEVSGNGTATWAAATVANGTAVFQVAVESAFRYKVLAWRTRHHAVRVAGDVAVDSNGTKTAQKGIRLSSATPSVCCRPTLLPLTVPVIICTILLA